MINAQEVLAMQANSISAMQSQQMYAMQNNAAFGYSMMGHNLPAQNFSYGGGSETGYGFSNQVGMQATGMANTAFRGAGYAAAGMGAYGGFKMGGLGGALRGGLAAGGLGIGSALTVGSYAASNMMEGASEQNEMFQMLGQNFRFSNAGSRTGRGFSRQDAKGISDFTRELSALPEMLTSFGELKSIMEKAAQSGLMNGARNAQEFQRRFKETLSTLKEVSKVMETSLEGAMQYFNEARRSGLYNPQMIKMNAAQRQFTAGVTGMDQNQVGQLMQFGSQMSFATGGFRGSGAQSALRSARQIGMANEMGLISNDRIAELTGMEGGAGIQAMAGGLTEAAHRMSQGSLGTAMSIALAKQDKSGRFTGAMDQDLIEKVRMGGISKEQLLSLAHKKTASQVSKISFKSQENKLRSEMSSQVGVEGMGMELQDILGGAGWQNPDAVNLVMQRYGLDERTSKMIQELGNSLPSIQRELGSKAQTEGRRMAEQSHLKENLSADAMKRKFMKKLENTFSEPFKKWGADLSNSVGDYVDNFMDGVLGRHSTNISRETASMAGSSLGGGKSGQANMAAMLSGVGTMPMGTGSVRSGLSESIIDTATGYRSDDMKKASFLDSITGKGLASKGKEFGMFKAVFGDTHYGQTTSQIAATKQYLGDLQAGKISGGAATALNHKDAANIKSSIAKVIKEYGHEMKEMSQADRIKFIRDKVGSGILSDLRSLERNGVSLEEIISHVQNTQGLSTHIGSVNFNKFSSEMYGTSDFGGAKELSAAEKTARDQLSQAFGHQSSQVTALLGTDSKSRDLFLKAAGGDKEAQSLLTKDIPVAEREKLLKKYGVSEQQLDHLQGIYGGAKGADVSGLAKNMQVALNRSSVGGLAAQLRRQGLDIEGRSGGLLGGQYGAKDSISALAKGLSGLTDMDSMNKFLGAGGSGAKLIDDALSSVSKLTGSQREKALAALGDGASSAIGFGDYVTRQASRHGGLEGLKDKLPADMVEEFMKKSKPGGFLSKEDAAELGRRARNNAYGGSLTAAGNVVGKEIQFQKELTENLNRFAQTTSQFAELVIQANPQLSENVKKARENIANSSTNITNGSQPTQ